MKTYTFGFDSGNGAAKGAMLGAGGQPQFLAIPSVVATGTLGDLETIRAASGQQQENLCWLGKEDYVLSHGGEHLYLGQLALLQATDPQFLRGDITRYWSPASRWFLLALAATLISEREFGLTVVTGLPAETYSAVNRQQVSRALEGDHAFRLGGIERAARVSVAAVVQEGAAGAVLFGTNKPVKQVTIDIGERTTDIWATNGQQPIKALCRGIDKGVGHAADLLVASCFAAYRRKLTLLEARDILRSHVKRQPYPEVWVSGRMIAASELASWAEDALRQTGKLICAFIKRVLLSTEQGDVGTDLSSALLMGGGAYYFLSDIRTVLPFALIAQNAEYVNALFYAKTASRIVEKQRLSQVKAAV